MRKYTISDSWRDALYYGIEYVKKNNYDTGPQMKDCDDDYDY